MQTRDSNEKYIVYMRTNFDWANDLLNSELIAAREWGERNGLMIESNEVRAYLSLDENGNRSIAHAPSAVGIEATFYEYCRVMGISYSWVSRGHDATPDERAAIRARPGDECGTAILRHSARRAQWVKDLQAIEKSFAAIAVLTNGEADRLALMQRLESHVDSFAIADDVVSVTRSYLKEEASHDLKYKMTRLDYAFKRARTSAILAAFPQVATLRLIMQRDGSAANAEPLTDEPDESFAIPVAPVEMQRDAQQHERNRATMRGQSNLKSAEPFG